MKKSILLGIALFLSVLLSAVSHDVNFNIADLEFSKDDRGYDIIRMDELLVINERSKPELPVKFVNLIIPCGMEVDEINITTQQQNIEGNFTVIPSPGPMIITDPPLPADPDSTIYHSSETYPNQPVEVLSHGYFDGANRIVSLAIYPVQFIPVQNALLFNDNIYFALSFNGSESPDAVPQYRLLKYDIMYDKALRSIVENDNDVDTYKHQPIIINELREDDVEMYIIGEAQYAFDFNDYIEWKRLKGMRVEYQTTEAIWVNYPNGDNWNSHTIDDMAGRIRAFLRDVYSNNCTVYTLLVGGSTDWDSTPQPNDDNLPIRYGTYYYDGYNNTPPDTGWQRQGLGWAPDNNFWRIPADLYFQEFDGDYDVEGDTYGYYGESDDDVQNEPEMFVGRLVISDQDNMDNHLQIQQWIKKLITYETNPGYGDFNYLENTTLFNGFWDNSGSGTIYNGTFDNLLFDNFLNYDYIAPTHNPAYPTGTQVLEYLNSDVGFSHFYWHGAKFLIDNCANPSGDNPICSLDYYDDYFCSYPSNGFDNLDEDGKFSICYMSSCNPGSYDKSQGTSNPLDDYWGNYISMSESFSTFVTNTGGPAIVANTNVGWGTYSESIEKRFLESIFDNDNFNIGIALGSGKSQMNSYYTRPLMLCTTLFGDPEMEVWTDIPEYLDVVHSYATNTVSVECGGTPVENATVYFATENCSDTEVIQTDANGIAQCSFDYQEICVTKHNYVPYIKRVIRGNETWTETTDLKWDVIIPDGFILDIDCEVNLLSFGGKNAQIIVEEGGCLNMNENSVINGYKKTFIPDEFSAIQIEIPGNKIEVYGSISINDASLLSPDDGWDGVFIYDCDEITFTNPTFENCDLYLEDTEISINDGNFANSIIEHHNNVLNLTNVDFYDSFIYANATGSISQDDSDVQILSCSINNSLSGTAIYISSYSNFTISGNYITCNGTGIDINESGTGLYHKISNNEINGNSNSFGILLYHTYVDITGHNNIHNKNVGILGMSNCEINLVGDANAPYQQIHNNGFDELIFTHDSFPYRLYYNKIYDNDHENYLLKCADHGGARPHRVTNNYWGDDFDPDLDFYPADAFVYEPIWNPGGIEDGTVEEMFSQAKQYEEEGNYDLARQLYKAIISDFPESDLAKASAKELFSLEAKSDKNFTELKSYYLTEPNMSYDEDIQKLSGYLSNYCEVKMLNFETAITYCEDIITDPSSSFQDSIYAVINAGYIYLMMEEEDRSSYIGEITSLKPKSSKEFELKRDHLLNILFGNQTNDEEDTNIPSVPVLSNNFPNPFNPTTTISFSIPVASKIELSVYNIKGQKVKSLVTDSFESGNHSVIWNGKDDTGKSIGSGVYFYKLNVNGVSNQIRKCILMK